MNVGATDGHGLPRRAAARLLQLPARFGCRRRRAGRLPRGPPRPPQLPLPHPGPPAGRSRAALHGPGPPCGDLCAGLSPAAGPWRCPPARSGARGLRE